MKTTLKLEELGIFFLGLFLFSLLEFQWWIFALLFFLPDIGMLGYVFGNKAGAFAYNIFHHKGIAVALYVLGVIAESEWVQLSGLVLLSHSAFDRILGYGLKYERGFKFTHLGEIGKS